MKNYFIGIDFSKKTFDATVLKKDEPCGLGVHQVFNNTESGINNFKKWIIKTTETNKKVQRVSIAPLYIYNQCLFHKN